MCRNDVLIVDADLWKSKIQLPNPAGMQMYFRLIDKNDAVIHGTWIGQTRQVLDNHLLTRGCHMKRICSAIILEIGSPQRIVTSIHETEILLWRADTIKTLANTLLPVFFCF